MLKIIYSDNIPSDTSSESTWLENINSDHHETAQKICAKLNQGLGDYQGPYYRVVDQSHVLYKWEP